MAIDRDRLITTAGARFEPDAYAITLEPLAQEDGGGWFATVPDLPGCMGDGETEQEAIKDVRAAALEWADAMLETDRAIPAPKWKPAPAWREAAE